MHKLSGLLFFAALAVLGGAAVTRADTLLIERRPAVDQVQHPARGTLMAAVEQNFGPPLHRVGPIGEPPITRWVYSEITVYFERDHVISSVINQSAPNEQGPRPVH